MSRDRSGKPKARQVDEAGVGRRAFLGATVLAVLLAAILIGISIAQTTEGNVGADGSEYEFADGTSLGSPDAPVTIVMYSEFQCSVCQAFAAGTEKELKSVYVETGKVRLEYKHFVIFGEESMQAAIASEAAADQNRFWEYYDVLMAARPSAKTEGDLTTADLQRFAEQIGLDMEEFNSSLSSGKHRDKIDRDFNEALALELRGTPTFFINGEKVEGNIPFPKLQERLDKLLGEGVEG